MPYQFSTRHLLPAATGFLPLDWLRDGGKLFLCGQDELFDEDEGAWANDDGGQWRGPAPCRAVPSNLRIFGFEDSFIVGADEIHRIESGSDIWAACELMEAGGTSGGSIEFRLQDAATGDDILTVTSRAIPAVVSLGIWGDGSYLLLARLAGAGAEFRLPGGYVRNNALYAWGTGETEYWDYDANVGRFPPADHPSWEKRAQLLDSNTQTDVPAWADYIIANADDTRGGEWSARGFVVGEGEWAPSPDLIPLCGPSVFEVQSLNARAPIPVEPFARTGNVLKKSKSGELLLAGQRMTPSGLNACLWRRESGVWVLLGANENPSTGLCECSLANHGPTSIVESEVDGRIYVLTKCSLHVYDAGAPRVLDRLPGVPMASGGHPGGHSLVEVEGRQYFTSENFGETNFTDERGQIREQFYDFLSIQQGATRAQGPGTVFHGTNDLTMFFGRLWGVMQDKANSNDAARQFITWFDGGDWSFETSLVYPAKAFRWQRLFGVEGLPNLSGREQQILLAFGRMAQSEQGIIGIGDGRDFRWETFDYRIRRASVSPAQSGDANSVLVIARACDAETIDESAWHLLEITAAQTADEGDESGGGDDDDDRLDPPPDAETLAIRLSARPGRPIHAIQVIEAGRERVLERYNREVKAIRYRVDSSEAPDDLASYPNTAPLSRFEPLPRAAQTVDVLCYLPPSSDDAWNDQPDISVGAVRRC